MIAVSIESFASLKWTKYFSLVYLDNNVADTQEASGALEFH